MIGMGWPVGDSGFGVGGGRPPRRARGTYGVYVVWSPVVGCRGGGRMGPARAGADIGGTGERGVPGGESGRLSTEDVGEDVVEEVGVPAKEGVGDDVAGTTSG